MQRLNVEYTREDDRGILMQVNTGEWKQLNHLLIKQGMGFGGHYHKHKRELFYLIKGEVDMNVIDKRGGHNIKLQPGSCILIEPYDNHTLNAIVDSELMELLSEPYDKEDVYNG